MNQNKKENLMNKSLIDLREMLERENKLLANRKFIDKLKDKGEKIKKFKNEIERIIKIKQSVEETESFLANLSLGDKTTILPKHPMFSINSKDHKDDDLKLAKQAFNKERETINKDEIVQKLLNNELDIYSVALSKTFDEELSQRRGERFMPNKIYKNINRLERNKLDNKLDNKTISELNDRLDLTKNKVELNDENKDNQIKTKVQINESNDSDTKTNKEINQNKKVNLFEKYKDTALEPYDKNKFVALTIENSLEFGKEQKVKDFEVEKIKLEARLAWRTIKEFDTDESSDNETDQEEEEDLMF